MSQQHTEGEQWKWCLPLLGAGAWRSSFGLWVKVLKLPYRIVFPMILFFCIIGAYPISLSTLDLKLMLGFGVLGYLMRKFEFDTAPLVLAFLLGPMMEMAMRQSLILSPGQLRDLLHPPPGRELPRHRRPAARLQSRAGHQTTTGEAGRGRGEVRTSVSDLRRSASEYPLVCQRP